MFYAHTNKSKQYGATIKESSMAKKILFINQEISPYVPETTLSVMGRDLPSKMQEDGFEIRTFMPKWGNINERRGQLHEVIRLSGMNLVIDDTDHPLIIKVASIPQTRLQVYFIDNDDYFMKRKMAVDDNGEEYDDNGERAIFFARGVLETVKKLRWSPEVIHCQGWMGYIVPLFIKTAYKDEPTFAGTKVVTSIFSQGLTKKIGDNFKRCLEFKDVTVESLSDYKDDFDFTEMCKLAIDHSDAVVQAEADAYPELIEYAKSKGIEMLPYQGEDADDAYKAFYESL